ncbi:hypothetical protein SESBI_39089 [Sesbania bispinosa]|nr:hypothetical protein SESBI_39089 [Sesbania bispinosa]
MVIEMLADGDHDEVSDGNDGGYQFGGDDRWKVSSNDGGGFLEMMVKGVGHSGVFWAAVVVVANATESVGQ